MPAGSRARTWPASQKRRCHAPLCHDAPCCVLPQPRSSPQMRVPCPSCGHLSSPRQPGFRLLLRLMCCRLWIHSSLPGAVLSCERATLCLFRGWQTWTSGSPLTSAVGDGAACARAPHPGSARATCSAVALLPAPSVCPQPSYVMAFPRGCTRYVLTVGECGSVCCLLSTRRHQSPI